MKKFNLQSAKFNCGARKGKSAFGKISLNFALCTLLIGAAEAAKFCVVDGVASWSADANARTWTSTMTNGAVISGRYACSSDLSYEAGCSNNIPAGCAASVEPVSFASARSGYAAKPVHSSNGYFCWCQTLSPNPTGWVVVGRLDVWLGGCNGSWAERSGTYPNCANLCAGFQAGKMLLTGPIDMAY